MKESFQLRAVSDSAGPDLVWWEWAVEGRDPKPGEVLNVVAIDEQEYEDLLWLRSQAKGVFVVARGAPPPPGPKLNTPQKRLEEKRRREGR